MKRLAALSLVVIALVAGCGSDDEETVAGDDAAPGESSEQLNDADVMFLQMMIHHHEQAVEMTELVEDRAESEDVRELAQRIEAAQGPEIEQMTTWLEEFGEPVEMDMSDMDMEGMDMDDMEAMDIEGMSGMMSKEDMEALADAEGAEFDEMFLEMMIEHHRGAVDMAEDELEAGQFAEALELAQAIIDSQTAEIEEMEALLAA